MITAFTYMFKDNMLLKKALPVFGVGLGHTFCPLISEGLTKYANIIAETNPSTALKILLGSLLILILGFICTSIYFGYLATCVKSVATQKENIVLPFLNLKKNIKVGLKYIVASLLFIVFLIALILPAFILTLNSATKTLGIILAIITVLLLIVITTTCSMGLFRIFTHKEELTSFIQFKRLFQLIAKDKIRYFKALGFSLILSTLTISLIAIPIVGMIVFAILIPYITFVAAYLIANSISTEQFESI